MRMERERRCENLIQRGAAGVERADGDIASARDDFDRRRHRSHVPARIPPRKLITGGKIYAALRVQFLEKTPQTPAIGHVGNGARDGNAARGGIALGAHKTAWEGLKLRISR